MKAVFFWLLLLLPVFVPGQERADLMNRIRELNARKFAYLDSIRLADEKLESLKLQRIRLDLMQFAIPHSPNGNPPVWHAGFVLGYDEFHEQASWVAHILTSDIVGGSVQRTNDFREDSLVPSGTASLHDYWDSGYDRGHLVPSADFRWSRQALSETYVYSNISPQLPDFNRGIWADLENKVRSWAIRNRELFVVTGGVLRPGLPTIGSENQVSVPEYFYKVLLDYTDPEIKGIAFVLPNAGSDRDPLDFAVSIDSVERLSGLDFFPALPDDLEDRLEKEVDPFQWEPDTATADSAVFPAIVFQRGMIPAADAKYYVGNRITVCGTVVSARFIQNGTTDPTYLNLDKAFPDQVFTLLIEGEDRVNFSYEPDLWLVDKQVCVRGKVEKGRGVPQMRVTDEKKIQIIGEEGDY
jgi:endonuclease G